MKLQYLIIVLLLVHGLQAMELPNVSLSSKAEQEESPHEIFKKVPVTEQFEVSYITSNHTFVVATEKSPEGRQYCINLETGEQKLLVEPTSNADRKCHAISNDGRYALVAEGAADSAFAHYFNVPSDYICYRDVSTGKNIAKRQVNGIVKSVGILNAARAAVYCMMGQQAWGAIVALPDVSSVVHEPAPFTARGYFHMPNGVLPRAGHFVIRMKDEYKLVNAANGVSIKAWQAPKPVVPVAVNEDKGIVAYCTSATSISDTILLRDLNREGSIDAFPPLNIIEHSPQLSALCFAHKGKHLLTGSGNGNVRLWDWESGTCLYECCLPAAEGNRIQHISYSENSGYPLLALTASRVLWHGNLTTMLAHAKTPPVRRGMDKQYTSTNEN